MQYTSNSMNESNCIEVSHFAISRVLDKHFILTIENNLFLSKISFHYQITAKQNNKKTYYSVLKGEGPKSD